MALSRISITIPGTVLEAADRILSFDRYEDYLDWRRRDDLVWR